MKDRTNQLFILFLFYAAFLFNSLASKKTFYIVGERACVLYYNKKYGANVTFTSTRYSRSDPMYYIGVHADTLIDLDNNVTIHFYAVSYPITGPVLMELHYRWCDLLINNEIIGALMRNFIPPTCPTPKGTYKISNLTTAAIPSFFLEHLPFTKARVYANASIFNEKLLEGYIDLEVKRKKK